MLRAHPLREYRGDEREREVADPHHGEQVTRPGGTLIASGIIAERRHEAENPLRDAGLRDIRALVEGDWVTLVGRRAE